MQANDAEGRMDDRLRKERKGKERKGKERKGKERNLAKVDRYLHGKRGGVNSG